MKRGIFRQAMLFLAAAQTSAQKEGRIFNSKEALKDSPYKGINFQESPMFFPTKSQKIKAKRLAKRNGR